MRSALVKPGAPPTPPPPPPAPSPSADEDDERTAAERKRMIRGSNRSGGSDEDFGISSGMVRILAFAVALPSKAWRSTAAAWHETSSSFGAPIGVRSSPLRCGDLPVSARASRPPSETLRSPSSSSSPAGAIVEMSMI